MMRGKYVEKVERYEIHDKGSKKKNTKADKNSTQQHTVWQEQPVHSVKVFLG